MLNNIDTALYVHTGKGGVSHLNISLWFSTGSYFRKFVYVCVFYITYVCIYKLNPRDIGIVVFNCKVISDYLQPHELHQTRLPCPSPILGACSNHVHQVSDAIQPSHHLLPPSSPALSLSQHQGLFQWVSSFHHVAKVFKLQFKHQSFQWILRVDFP